MPDAVGVIETIGFPSILAAADAMVKAARVTLVYYGIAERGHFVVAVRGPNSEVYPSVQAGIEAAEKVYGGIVDGHYIVPNPPENVESVLPLSYTEISEQFR
ncbi:BMC domain-containing protein [Okeania sp. SIO2B3]|uniref:BMC domain-containing protein n=1 Tax=Okeania sp. SIO2B3 TaxID=2607784 RepID=UPI0013BF7322|nr:BMC domain-containing protein [Okeania sp. SIO2B3]MDY7008625.1 BMC domain-containing protein [Cyanobacteriota bacterium]NET45953.1 BMC domain-containing protein [Okeania sp. SIO2B3]